MGIESGAREFEAEVLKQLPLDKAGRFVKLPSSYGRRAVVPIHYLGKTPRPAPFINPKNSLHQADNFTSLGFRRRRGKAAQGSFSNAAARAPKPTSALYER